MNILVVGSTGFIGKTIVEVLKDKGHMVYTLARQNADYTIDLSKQIPEFIQAFDMVVHAAGLAHTTTASNEMYDHHVQLTNHLLSGLTSQSSLKSIVYLSSVSVYGISQGELIDEMCFPLPQTAYGKAKLATEEALEKWVDNRNINLCVLRLPLVFGLNAPGNLAKMKQALERGYFFLVGQKDVHKSIVHVNDVANVIDSLLTVKGVYNLTDGLHPSFKAISNFVAPKNRIKNIPNWVAYYLAKCGDLIGPKLPFNSAMYTNMISTLTFDDKKAKEAFDWQPKSALRNE